MSPGKIITVGRERIIQVGQTDTLGEGLNITVTGTHEGFRVHSGHPDHASASVTRRGIICHIPPCVNKFTNIRTISNPPSITIPASGTVIEVL